MNITIEKQENTAIFEHIVAAIRKAKNKKALIYTMKHIFSVYIDAADYKYGFGGHHMWLSNQQNERLILVTFPFEP